MSNVTLTPAVAAAALAGAAAGVFLSTGKLYLTELASLAQNSFGGGAQLGHFASLADQRIPFAAGIGALSNPFTTATRILRLHTDSVCSVNIGCATANTANMRLAANSTEYVTVEPGSMLTVIGNS